MIFILFLKAGSLIKTSTKFRVFLQMGHYNIIMNIISVKLQAMQEKLQKLFSFFTDIKNQPFYTSCISQIIDVYEASPQSLKFILFNLNQLIFSPCKEIRLRLKHRQICASIISKLNKIYCERVRQFIQNKQSFDLQSFQLEQGISKSENKATSINWQTFDYIKFIQDEKLLLATEKGRNQLQGDNSEIDQKKIFDEFVDMKHATMINMEELFKDIQGQNQFIKAAYDEKRSKYSKKAQKYKQKEQQKQSSVEVQLTISNPFNLLFQICMQNITHSEWELRHLSVLILKELLLHSQFLGFSHTFSMGKMSSVQKRFQYLSIVTKQALLTHFKSPDKKKQIFQEVTSQTLIVLCLDRFADYQTDQSVIIVRMVAAQILMLCFKTFEEEDQSKMYKFIKKIFDKEIPTHQFAVVNKVKFTWQVKHSFLYFLTLLIQKPQFYGPVFKYFQEPFIKMLSTTQIDEIILCICKILRKFVGQKFFQQKAIDRVNQQIWMIIEHLDDISISTKQTLSLLGVMFPHFKLNESVCLERIQKFFTSKIPQVRLQLYNIVSLIYKRNWKAPQKCKIIEQNIIQLLQASIIQFQPNLFKQLIKISPSLMSYVIKDKKIRKIIQFINDCILNQESTQLIISKKFKDFDQTKKSYENAKTVDKESQYFYIYQEDRVGVPSNVYVDKRIWKVAQVISAGFKQNSQGLEELIRGIQKLSQKNNQRHILIYLILDQLVNANNKKHKMFIEYLNKAQEILKIQSYSQMSDPKIQIYIKQFETIFEKVSNNPNCLQVKKLKDKFKTTGFNPKDNAELHKNLKDMIQNIQEEAMKIQVRYLISLLQNIIQNQNQLLKRVKLLSSYFSILMTYPQEPTGLNNLIKSILQILREDAYVFLSQSSSNAAFYLSNFLFKKKKAIYQKFNTNIILKIQSSYNEAKTKIKQKQNSVKLQSSFMKAISLYFQKIGTQIPGWIDEFSELFIKDLTIQQNTANKDKLMTLYGTIISLLKIDSKQVFLKKFISLVSKLTDNVQEQTKNIELIQKILSKSFLFFSENYTEMSNTFFEWFLKEMQKYKRIFYSILENNCNQNLVRMTSVCSLFMMNIVKSISIVDVQDIAMNCLSNLIVGVYTNNVHPNFSKNLSQMSEEGVQFIKNFKDTSKFNYNIEVELRKQIDLRNYQKEGITWLGFLCKYNLNGALCDDMGLGKTLQILILIQNQYKKGLQSNSSNKMADSLIIVPTTLVEHWGYEYLKYFQELHLNLILINNKTVLQPGLSLLGKEKKPNLYITNYSLVQKFSQDFENYHFKFIVLDEGHIIKNVKTKKFKAVRKLKSQHRFILTGTPIQNRLKQLWGLFDFLMPGYLDSQEMFKKNYEKLFEVNLTTFQEDQLMFSQNQKQVLEKLHFKVMPFILRRLKTDVLKQLPSKIINDYYCQLTNVQSALYNKFEDQKCGNKVNFNQEKNVLTVLVQMRKILNHPNQLVGDSHPWDASGKYIALSELFQQLGFSEEDSLIQNKAIIFSRFTHTIDLIQSLFMKERFGHIKYLKLTGATKIGDRFQVAQKFNGDSDIKILLVTTAVGGEGLNLSSANVVIMFDHDYNPTVDMQAIDRAHRIGQKRVLNVYRLITKNTLEERIMGIQRFKTNLANAIVNIDNASIQNIKQSNLPALLEKIKQCSQAKDVQSTVGKSLYKELVAELEKNSIQTDEYSKKY